MADPRPLTHVAEFLLRHPPTDLTASSHLNDLCEEGEQSTTTLTQDLFHWLHTFQNCEDDCQFSFLYILALYCFRNVTHDWSTGAHLRLLGPWATEEQNPDVRTFGGWAVWHGHAYRGDRGCFLLFFLLLLLLNLLCCLLLWEQ